MNRRDLGLALLAVAASVVAAALLLVGSRRDAANAPEARDHAPDPSEIYGKPAIDRLPSPDALRSLDRARSADVKWMPGRTQVERGTASGDELRAILAAIGTEQAPQLGCEQCVPQLSVTFRDAAGNELGRLEAFCPRAELEKLGRFRDATSKACQTVELRAAKSLRALAQSATSRGAGGHGSPR